MDLACSKPSSCWNMSTILVCSKKTVLREQNPSLCLSFITPNSSTCGVNLLIIALPSYLVAFTLFKSMLYNIHNSAHAHGHSVWPCQWQLSACIWGLETLQRWRRGVSMHDRPLQTSSTQFCMRKSLGFRNQVNPDVWTAEMDHPFPSDQGCLSFCGQTGTGAHALLHVLYCNIRHGSILSSEMALCNSEYCIMPSTSFNVIIFFLTPCLLLNKTLVMRLNLSRDHHHPLSRVIPHTY